MRHLRYALLLGAACCPSAVVAQSAPPKSTSNVSVKPLAFTERVLANGLRVYAIRNTAAPNVSVQVWYDVGSKDDPKGRIEASGARALSAGDVTPLGRDLIHSVNNPIDKLTGAIHVYGGDFFEIERSEWDAESLVEGPYDMAKTRALFGS